MQNAKIMAGTVSSWVMAFAYDWINKATGHEYKILLYTGLVTLAIGLYVGLCAKSNKTEKEEA